MAARKKAAQAAGTARSASAPFIQRLIEDDELRDNVRQAYASARNAYGRLSNGKGPAKTIVDDKKFQREVQSAASALRDAGSALKEGPKRKRRSGGVGRKLVVLAVGASLAVALSEGLRNKLLDALFGAEEEFEYSSTTAPNPAPAPVSAS